MPPGRGLDAYREVWLVDFEFSAPPGERPTPFAWWPGSSDPAGPSGCGKMISGAVGCLPTRSAPIRCSSPTSRRPSWVAISRWVGPSRPVSWISTSEFRNRTNGLSPPNGFGLLGALAWSRPGRDGRGRERKPCESWPSAAVPGRRPNGRRCWPIASPTSRRWPGCSPRWGRSWISPGPWPVGAGTWRAVARMEWAGVPIDVRDPLPAPGRLGVDPRSAHSRRLTPGLACSTAGRSRPSVGPVGWPDAASRGPGWSPGSWRWTMTRSGRWPGAIPTWP